MRPSRVRPRGIFTAGWCGCRAAIKGRWRAILAESGTAGSILEGWPPGRPRPVRNRPSTVISRLPRRVRLEELGLPREQDAADARGIAGQQGELRARGDQGGIELKFSRKAVPQTLDLVLTLELGRIQDRKS